MVISILVLVLVSGTPETIEDDLLFITTMNPVYEQSGHKHERADFSMRQSNELRLAFTGMIRLYQVFVSPQGPPACNFTVTCSQFLSRAVRTYGFIHGLLMGADRLTRCTHSTRRLYEIEAKTGKAIDYPVDAYYLFSRSRVYSSSSSPASEKPSTHVSSSPIGGEELKEGGSQ